MNTEQMHNLLSIAIGGVREAGQEILKLYVTTNFEIKSDGSPVTIADTHSNKILLRALAKTGITILSEESSGIDIPYPEHLWIIDPIDGTKDFINKTDDFSVMVGLLEHGRPILGVVYVPVYDTLYTAMTGAGAFVTRGGVTKKLTVSNKSGVGLRFIRSINHFTDDMAHVAEKLSAELYPRGSIGIKAGVIAEAEGDFFFSHGDFGEWDVCAPEIITSEAGGCVTDCNGKPLFYGTHDHRVEHGIVFSNSACHEQVLNAIAETPK